MSDWQRIETAPKDGTEILVWDSDGNCREMVVWDDQYEQWTITAYCGGPLPDGEKAAYAYSAVAPTYWMPLPPPPESG